MPKEHKVGDRVSWCGILYKVTTTSQPCEIDGSYCYHCFNYRTCYDKAAAGKKFKKFRKL